MSEILDVGTERQQHAGAVRLVPDRTCPDGSFTARGIGEAAHAAHRAEVVVERSVLLHQDDDVLDVVDGAGAVVRRNGERPARGPTALPPPAPEIRSASEMCDGHLCP